MQSDVRRVSLLANVVATEPSPSLDILSVDLLADRSQGKAREVRTLVKLACHAQGACLPFYAIVSRQETEADDAPSALSAISSSGVVKQQDAIVIRPGAHAILVMDDARSHVQISVVSLENGIAGHRIHVASPDHKKVYLAEVVSARLLKGSL
jgi:hypothetical protein